MFTNSKGQSMLSAVLIWASHGVTNIYLNTYGLLCWNIIILPSWHMRECKKWLQNNVGWCWSCSCGSHLAHVQDLLLKYCHSIFKSISIFKLGDAGSHPTKMLLFRVRFGYLHVCVFIFPPIQNMKGHFHPGFWIRSLLDLIYCESGICFQRPYIYFISTHSTKTVLPICINVLYIIKNPMIQ